MNKFECTKCGCCCRNLNLNELYFNLDRGDGICKHFDENNNICLIYNERPIICNVNKMYEYYFSNQYTIEQYYNINKASCDMLIKYKQKIEKIY